MLRLAYFIGNYYPKGSSQKFADDRGRGLTGARRAEASMRIGGEDSSKNGAAAGSRIFNVSTARHPSLTSFARRSSSPTGDALHSTRP